MRSITAFAWLCCTCFCMLTSSVVAFHGLGVVSTPSGRSTHQHQQQPQHQQCCSVDKRTLTLRYRGGDVGAPHTLGMVNDAAEYTRQLLQEKQADYEAKLKAQTAASMAANSAISNDVLALSDIPLVPYLNEQGMISDVSDRSAKASVYAIYGEEGTLQFIGVTRGIQPALRLHLARCPDLCWGIKVQHIQKPSRAILEVIKEKWISEEGVNPPGNDKGPIQAQWEAPLDVKKLMTEKDMADFETAKDRGKEESALKKIARRFEAEKVAVLEARGVKEGLRFDPKLKGKGLLDLLIDQPKNEVPK